MAIVSWPQILRRQLTTLCIDFKTITFVVLFDPDPRFPAESDPVRSGGRYSGQVVEQCPCGVDVGEGGGERGQLGADRVAVGSCLEPGRDPGRPRRRRLDHAGRERGHARAE